MANLILSDINACYDYCNTIMRKKYSGSMSADEFNLWMPVAQALHMRVKLGLPESYHIGTGYPAQGQRRSTLIVRESAQELEASQTLMDQIRNFEATAPITGVNNVFQVPGDYVAYRPSNYRYTFQVLNEETGLYETRWNEVPFEFVTTGQRTYRLYNYIQKPSEVYPILSYNNGALQADADQYGKVKIQSINLNYVRMPKTPLRNYTPNANDQPIYNPVGSQDLEFPNLEWEEICQRLIKYWSIAIRDTEAYQLNDKAVNTGE